MIISICSTLFFLNKEKSGQALNLWKKQQQLETSVFRNFKK